MRNLKQTGNKENYYSYLLRMWQDRNGQGIASANETLWRASLQDPQNGKKLLFNSLEDLFCFLLCQAGLEHLAKDDQDQK